MPRLRTTITLALLITWWLLFGAAVGVAVAWTSKALAERGLARGPRWAVGMERPWPHTLPKDYAVPDDWMRVTEWWHTQDIGSWRKHKTYLITEASYGLPLRSVGELIAQQTTDVGPMLMNAPGTTARTGLLADLPLQIRWTGFITNAALYGALGWWFLRGRRWWSARRRRAAGKCPECSQHWTGATSDAKCAACIEWAARPRVRTWYWWKSTLSAPWWLAIGAIITFLIAWGGPYVGELVGHHLISRTREPTSSWPGTAASTMFTSKAVFFDPSDCWWGGIENYRGGWDGVRLIRGGSPFPCCSGIWTESAAPPPRALGFVSSIIAAPRAVLMPGPLEDVWTIQLTKKLDLEFPCRFLWVGLVFDTLFWAIVAWFAWRGPAAIRSWRWRSAGKCGTCGYSLAGLAPGARCPECGNIPIRRPALSGSREGGTPSR